MDLYPKHHLPDREVRKFIVIFNIVGLAGFLLPISRDYFIKMTPMALLLNTYLLLLYVRKYSMKTIVAFVAVFALGFGVEVAGVNTGKIFGQYVYGDGLGPKLWDTPLLIGVNWLFLTFSSLSIVSRWDWAEKVYWLIAPGLMLCYDLVLEQVAPVLDMWEFEGGSVPLKNYIVWYVLGVLFTLLLKWCGVKLRHSLAPWLMGTQLVFFIVLMLVLA